MLRDFAAFTGSIRAALAAETVHKDYGGGIRVALDERVAQFCEEQSAIAEASPHMLASALSLEEKEALARGQAPSQPSSYCTDRELQLANYVKSDAVVYNFQAIQPVQKAAPPPDRVPAAEPRPAAAAPQ